MTVHSTKLLNVMSRYINSEIFRETLTHRPLSCSTAKSSEVTVLVLVFGCGVVNDLQYNDHLACNFLQVATELRADSAYYSVSHACHSVSSQQFMSSNPFANVVDADVLAA